VVLVVELRASHLLDDALPLESLCQFLYSFVWGNMDVFTSVLFQLACNEFIIIIFNELTDTLQPQFQYTSIDTTHLHKQNLFGVCNNV
jgi:hypothetical protein